METKTKEKALKVATWLPGFDGYYGSIFDEDSGEENEIDNINQERKEKGLPEIGYDDCEWDYEEFYKNLSEDITGTVGNYLQDHKLIHDYEFEKLSSPREYNFVNDSIHVTFILLPENEKNIMQYLSRNKAQFETYLKDKYTSRSGFISSYSNDVYYWLQHPELLTHEHMLGAVLNFILRSLLVEDQEIKNVDDCLDFWLAKKADSANSQIQAQNYHELIKGDSNEH